MHVNDIFKSLLDRDIIKPKVLASDTGYALSHIYRFGEPVKTDADPMATGVPVPVFVAIKISQLFNNHEILNAIALSAGLSVFPAKIKEFSKEDITKTFKQLKLKELKKAVKIDEMLMDNNLDAKDEDASIPILSASVEFELSVLNYLLERKNKREAKK